MVTGVLRVALRLLVRRQEDFTAYCEDMSCHMFYTLRTDLTGVRGMNKDEGKLFHQKIQLHYGKS